MRRLLAVIVALVITCSQVYCQSVEDIAFYADAMVNAVQDVHRIRANDKLQPLISEYLAAPDADLEALQEVKFISQQPLEGSDYVIYTWQLKVSEAEYQSFGMIKRDGGEVITLSAVMPDGDSKYEITDSNRWFGALYYKVMPTTVEGKPAWLLFGYDGFSQYNRRKILDVITIEDGQVRFGAELFKRDTGGPRPDIYNRIILEYSKDSNVTLNYNPALEIIMHDHLINRMGRIPGQGATWLADGSYEGYKFDGTHWVYDEKVFEQVTAEGEYPRPSPVLDIRGEGRGK